MTPVQIVAAIGADEHDLRVLQVAGEEHDEITGRPVGPVQVFDHEQHGNVRAEALDDAEQMLEEAALAGLGRDLAGRPQLREEMSELTARGADDGVEVGGRHRPHRLAQRLHDRTVRKRPVDQLQAGAGHDPSPASDRPLRPRPRPDGSSRRPPRHRSGRPTGGRPRPRRRRGPARVVRRPGRRTWGSRRDRARPRFWLALGSLRFGRSRRLRPLPYAPTPGVPGGAGRPGDGRGAISRERHGARDVRRRAAKRRRSANRWRTSSGGVLWYMVASSQPRSLALHDPQ